MIRTVDCDQVFDVLTRGPFPSGDSDDADVELHVRCCHDCRQLAEALRPAVGLIHETLLADESDQLPHYLGEFSTNLAAPWLAGEHLPKRSDLRRRRLRQVFGGFIVAAASMVLIVSAVGVWTRSNQAAKNPHGVQQSLGMVAWSDATERRLLDLGVPEACVRPSPSIEHADQHRHVCCTQCHGESQVDNREFSYSFQKLVAACLTCHTVGSTQAAERIGSAWMRKSLRETSNQFVHSSTKPVAQVANSLDMSRPSRLCVLIGVNGDMSVPRGEASAEMSPIKNSTPRFRGVLAIVQISLANRLTPIVS